MFYIDTIFHNIIQHGPSFCCKSVIAGPDLFSFLDLCPFPFLPFFPPLGTSNKLVKFESPDAVGIDTWGSASYPAASSSPIDTWDVYDVYSFQHSETYFCLDNDN